MTLTILLVVVTMNAINFIDGLDGLAAGIVAVAALSFLVYSYSLIQTIGSTSQSLPAVASALLAGMCLGFLPHNFYPARIFMGDIGAMLLGLLLAYGPISSTDSLDPALLTDYSQNHPLDRFPTFLPLLVPAAIFVIPYADLMFAVIRRTRAGKPLMAADRQHLHHRLLNIGHSYRQSVLLMYLWAALFSVAVVSLSLVRSPSVVFVAATLVAVLALLPATMPRLRPWRALARRKPPRRRDACPAAAVPARRRRPRPPAAAAPAAAAARRGPAARPGLQHRARPPATRVHPVLVAAPASRPRRSAATRGPPPRRDTVPRAGARSPRQAPFPGPDRSPGRAVPQPGPFPGPEPFPPRIPSRLDAPPDPVPGRPVPGQDPDPRRSGRRSGRAEDRGRTRFRRPSAPTRGPGEAPADLRMTRPLPFPGRCLAADPDPRSHSFGWPLATAVPARKLTG